MGMQKSKVYIPGRWTDIGEVEVTNRKSTLKGSDRWCLLIGWKISTNANARKDWGNSPKMLNLHFSSIKHVLTSFSSRVADHDLLYIIQLLQIMGPRSQMRRNPTKPLNSHVVAVHNHFSSLKCLNMMGFGHYFQEKST